MKNILEHEMNFIEKVITFVLRCLRIFRTGESRTLEVFKNITKIVNGLKLLYLRRWFLYENKNGSLYLHRIVRSDDDKDPHTHPWSFISLILWSGYFDLAYKIEHGLHGHKYLSCTIEQTKMFRIYRRDATHLHKAMLFKPSWSLVWVNTYDKENEWGFVLSNGTLVPYREYLKLPKNTPVAFFDRIDKQG